MKRTYSIELVNKKRLAVGLSVIAGLTAVGVYFVWRHIHELTHE